MDLPSVQTVERQLAATQSDYESDAISERNGGATWEEVKRCDDTRFDSEIFFPDKGGSTKLAKLICATCIVRIECLNYALRRDEPYGVWGGMSNLERRRLKRLAGGNGVDSTAE